jgi:hypothetical protein
MPDGRRFKNRQWALYFGALDGSVMSCWKTDDAESATSLDSLETAQSDAAYINLADAAVESLGIFTQGFINIDD